MTVAALYVETNGVYFGLPDVDPWDEQRDARFGCFAAALDAVRTFGGVLEHPAHSLAWKRFELPRPCGGGWTRSLLDDGWTCEVDQRRYGHEARKPTWVYYIGDAPPFLLWGYTPKGAANLGRVTGWHREHLRSRTPPAFRDVLLDMARSATAREGLGRET